MPRSIKQKMSKDELIHFDARITTVEFDEGEAVLVVSCNGDDWAQEIWLSEKDCEDLIQFIRRNKQ